MGVIVHKENERKTELVCANRISLSFTCHYYYDLGLTLAFKMNCHHNKNNAPDEALF